MSTNCTVATCVVTLTSLAITTPPIHGMAADVGDLAYELAEASAAALQPVEGRGNAAATYLRAFTALENAEITTEEWLAEGTSPRSPATWNPTLAKSLLNKSAEAISLSRQAAQFPWTAFGSDQPRTRGEIMPHLTPMRRLSRLIGMQARMDRIEGRDREANAMLRDICLIAQHTASDRVPIASLAASACALQAIEGIGEAIALGVVQSNDARSFLSVLGTGTDSFGYADAVASEREATLDWLHEDLAGALEEYSLARGETILESPRLVDNVKVAFDEVEAILRIDDPLEAKQRTAGFESDLAAGAYGALAQHLLANHARIIGIKLHMQKHVTRLESDLRAIQLGQDPATLANAAVLYEYAFPSIYSISHDDQEALEMVRGFVSVLGSTDGLPESTIRRAQEVLKRLEPARALIARAASCQRCTWAEAETAERLGRAIGEGTWIKPMRAIARICELEAALAIDNGNFAKANRSLADALAVAVHLADGSHLLGSVVAAATVVEVAELSKLTAGTKAVEGTRILLEKRLARVNQNDPLSWKASRESALRSQLRSILSHRFKIDEDTIAQRIARWNLDRLTSITYELQRQSDNVGELLSLDDVVVPENVNDRKKRLRAAGDQLDQVLMIIDTTKPIRTEKWRARALEALHSIQDDLFYSHQRLASSAVGQ